LYWILSSRQRSKDLGPPLDLALRALDLTGSYAAATGGGPRVMPHMFARGPTIGIGARASWDELTFDAMAEADHAVAGALARRWCTWWSEEDGRMLSHSSVLAVPMPHKHNADRRRHIPKMSFKVQNWPAYEAVLRRRGSLLLWIEDGALKHWQTCGPDGQARYTDAAIRTSLMLRTAFKLSLRQAEGLMASVLRLAYLRINGYPLHPSPD
jgi:hypothetical protein